MKITYLNGTRFYNAFYAGAHAVIKQRDYLNKINVFPVPDADTGNNFSATFRSIIEKSSVSPNLGETLQSMSDAALSGARGNAGIIFSQFLYGFANEIKKFSQVSVKHFAESIKSSIQYAYDALSSPVEGTILSVMKDWADTVYAHRHEVKDFSVLLQKSIDSAYQSLKETPHKLKVLAKAGVVDAGAQGFVDFLDGILEFLSHGTLKNIPEIPAVAPPIEAHSFDTDEDIEYRYCTEALISGDCIDKKALRTTVQSFGDSLIVAGSDQKVHLHIHTNRPAEFYASVNDFGTILEQKVDDMHKQYAVSHHRKADIALLTDSACDLPMDLLDERQIHLIPLKLFIDESTYLDKVTILPKLFYRNLDTTKIYPKTSQPSIVEFRNNYSFLASHYKSIIAVHLSQKLSGTWNASRQAAEKTDNANISVIDSKTLSGALGLIVLRISDAIQAGMSHADIVQHADDWITKTKIYVSVPSLKYMVRGGRVSPMKGLIARALNLKPIVSMDSNGESTLYGKSFSRSGSMKKILQYVDEFSRSGKVWNYSIFHANNEPHAQEYRQHLVKMLGKEPAYIMEISPIIGLHAGVGAVSVAVMHE